MSVNPADVHQRWLTIRKDPECNLSLDPEAIKQYLTEPETTIVRQRIQESLFQFAEYRLAESNYHSGNQSSGDLATCEGLEAFLVPAVEEAFKFSDFLANYPSRNRFVDEFKKDLQGLLHNWTKAKPEFSGKPYTDPSSLTNAVDPGQRDWLDPPNITETAALACRITVHLLSLKYGDRDEQEFMSVLGKDIDDDELLKALSQSIEFLVAAFQKSDKEGDEEAKIANATWRTLPGSGWSWTASPAGTSLPPMLFFTAAAVDAFAELDFYLIRPAGQNAFANRAPAIQQFFQNKQTALRQLSLCVDMSRRWILKAILPYLTSGFGQYQETYPDKSELKLAKQEKLDGYEKTWQQVDKLFKTPTLYYNSLYALQVLLWSFGDRTDDGTKVDATAKSDINRAITLLVSNYDTIPVVGEVLNKVDHRFLLPGKGIFIGGDESANCDYTDAGFLPALTRLLVLFVAYGVGDRNVLEPIIRDLYVTLLQRQNSKLIYRALWSRDAVEVYSTQRAIQALTFYYAYAAGKELADKRKGGGLGGELVRNLTDRQIFLQLVDESPKTTQRDVPERPPLAAPEAPAAAFKAKFGESFVKYLHGIPGWKARTAGPDEKEQEWTKSVLEFGEMVFADGKAGKIVVPAAVEVILRAVADLMSQPWQGERLREGEFDLLKQQYDRLLGK